MGGGAVGVRETLLRQPGQGTAGGELADGVGRRSGGPRRSERIELAAFGVGILHHTDHVLRDDHSGWPFRSEVTPFTVSLAVYPILLIVLLNRSRPWLRVGLVAGIFLATQGAHLLVESPADQFGGWAAAGAPNLLGVTSPALGLVSAGLSLLLSAMLLATLAAFVIDATRGDVAARSDRSAVGAARDRRGEEIDRHGPFE